MKRKTSLIAAIIGVSALIGCQTPQARYDTDNLIWTAATLSATVAEASGKLTPQETALVNANLATGDANLAAAATWLTENPTLAQTPGYNGPPTLSNFNVFLSALRSSLSAFVPATQP